MQGQNEPWKNTVLANAMRRLISSIDSQFFQPKLCHLRQKWLKFGSLRGSFNENGISKLKEVSLRGQQKGSIGGYLLLLLTAISPFFKGLSPEVTLKIQYS
jgi:hypothetical protein